MNLKLISGIAISILLFGIISYTERVFAQSSSNQTQKISKYDAKRLAAEKASAKAKERDAERAAAAEQKFKK